MHGSQFGLFDFQLFRESAAHLGYLKRMGETIMKDVAEFARDNLRGCREALQSGRIENNVPVALKVIPVIPLPTLLRKEPLTLPGGSGGTYLSSTLSGEGAGFRVKSGIKTTSPLSSKSESAS